MTTMAATLPMKLAMALMLVESAHSPVFAQAADASVQPPAFSTMRPAAGLAPWMPVRLGIALRPTRYEWVEDGDAVVLRAVAERAASGLAHPVTIDVRQTPIMAWRWKVAGLIPDADVRVASREDAPARILLEFDGDKSKLTRLDRVLETIGEQVIGRPLPFATLAYVWSNDLPVGTVVASPHTRRIQMIVASTGAADVGRWQRLARDVHADYLRAFGEVPGRLLSVGVLTDTDDTRGYAEAWYGDIRFEAPRP